MINIINRTMSLHIECGKYSDYLKIPSGLEIKIEEGDEYDPKNVTISFLEQDWIKEWYPELSGRFLIEYFKAIHFVIPKDNISRAIRVSFWEGGNCIDYFKNKNGTVWGRYNTKINFEDYPLWVSVVRESYEPLEHLHPDLLIQITDESGRVIISEQNRKCENGQYYAHKKIPFSWELEESEVYNLIYPKVEN